MFVGIEICNVFVLESICGGTSRVFKLVFICVVFLVFFALVHVYCEFLVFLLMFISVFLSLSVFSLCCRLSVFSSLSLPFTVSLCVSLLLLTAMSENVTESSHVQCGPVQDTEDCQDGRTECQQQLIEQLTLLKNTS